MRVWFRFSLCLILTSNACGSLDKVDENGSVNLVPANVQNIFTDHCAKSGCHTGSSPRAGQNLSESYAYNEIVNVTSSEQSLLKRVLPFDPDNSYLVRKIEGVAGIDGDRMPADGPPFLTTTQIDSIRLWITNGALPR